MAPPKKKHLPEADLLSALPLALRSFAAKGTLRRYQPNTLLIQEGDRGNTVFVVLSGRLRIYCSDYTERQITLAVYGPGEYVGEMSIDGGVRSASVVTESECVCSVVTGLTLRKHLGQDPAFALELIKRLARRAQLATESTRSMALLGAYGRFAKLFDSLAVRQRDGTRLIAQILTHQDIAQRVGCSREMISILLKDLANGGYLDFRQRQYVLLKKLPAQW